MALHDAELDHRLNKRLPPTSCTIGRSLLSAAVGEVLSFTYLIKPNRNLTKQRFLGFKNRNRTEFLKIETVTALIICRPCEYCGLSVKLAYMPQTTYTLVNALRSTDSWNRQLPGHVYYRQIRTAEVIEGASVYR